MNQRTSGSPTSNQRQEDIISVYRRLDCIQIQQVGNIWDNHFGEQTVELRNIDCTIKGDRTENLLYRIEDLIIPQHLKKFVIICGTNNL